MVEYTNAQGESTTLKLSSPFTRWFDVDGFFVAKPFQQWLASEIPLIGQVDPKNKGGIANAAANTNEVFEDAGPVEQENDTPKKSTPSDPAPTNTRSRRGKRG